MDRIQFDHVSKRYVLGARSNARESLAAAARNLLRRRSDQAEHFWALRDVDFSVADGATLGIVGRNGAGKSTILKIISGITTPSSGVSRTRGRLACLLEVGTGFHQELTGRENVYLNGAILGMSRKDIARAFDSIVDFSGVEPFLDTPVKRYSSGMRLRLAFAVAAHLEPDVLVVDEVLAVGDAEFQRQCLGRMEQAQDEGRTVLFVSHDLEALNAICRQSLWMESGRIRRVGPSDEIVRSYLASGLASEGSGDLLVRAGPVAVHAVRVLPDRPTTASILMREDPLRIEVDFDLADEVPGLDIALYLTTRSGVRVCDQLLSDGGPTRLRPGTHRATLRLPPVLNVGTFAVGIWFGTAQAQFIDEPAAASFTVYGSDHERPQRILALDLPVTVEALD